jgi:hypothetical protein
VSLVDDSDMPQGAPSRSILVTGARTIGGGEEERAARARYSGRRIDLDLKSADVQESAASSPTSGR